MGGYGKETGRSGDDPQLPGASDCFSPVGGIQLAINAGRVGFNRPGSNDELLSDLLVGAAQGHQAQDFQLAHR